jgi:Cu+-exporting ATPase
METAKYTITGKSCAACSARIERGLGEKRGVLTVHVNLASGNATVRYDPAMTSAVEIARSIQSLGYGAFEAGSSPYGGADDPAEMARSRESRQLALSLAVSALLSAPLLASMVLMLAGNDSSPLHRPLAQLILAAPVQFVVGWPFYRRAWQGLRAKSPGMDLLVAMGTSAAFFFSVYNGFFAPAEGVHRHLYFEASAIIITLVLLGKFFEARARGRASRAITKLMALRPDVVHLVRDGREYDVPAEEVVPGDVLALRPGETVPADGIVAGGGSAVDESMITGESMPVDKTDGSPVTGGTVNLHGALTIRVTKTGRDMMLSRIIRLVEDAQGSKAPIQRLADRVSAVFVPAVLAIALVTFILWMAIEGDVNSALTAAVSVLVISCPCALGLATPTAIMVGTGRGAQTGILIKNGAVLEIAEKINAMVFDKTGTMTEGKLSVHEIAAYGMDAGELLKRAAAAEHFSEHPLARAIVAAAEAGGLVPPSAHDFRALPGRGVQATVDDVDVMAGTAAFMAEAGIDCSSGDADAQRVEARGMTAVLVALDGRCAGVIALADTIRPRAAEMVERLRSRGIETFMITGDNRASAEAVAHAVGIDPAHVIADVLPEGKSAEITALRERGYVVAMVGDGINDAPALASADLGVAMGTGADIAMETSDMTLVRGDLSVVVAAINLSRRTMAKIRQNLFWAFFYNVIGIPVAALGLLNPIVAGAAMAFSSVSVVTNSLLLKKTRL